MDALVFDTEILRAPKRRLATFGATQINYRLVSPIDGMADRTRLREGTVISERPQILTAESFTQRFQGFGDKTEEHSRWIDAAYKDLLRALEYNFRNKDLSVRVLNLPPLAAAERILKDLNEHGQDNHAVIRCPDGGWSLALMKFTLEEASRSFPGHVRDFELRGMFSADKGESDRRRRKIEALFISATKNPSERETLGRMLKDYGLFEEYEDRFLSLFH